MGTYEPVDFEKSQNVLLLKNTLPKLKPYNRTCATSWDFDTVREAFDAVHRFAHERAQQAVTPDAATNEHQHPLFLLIEHNDESATDSARKSIVGVASGHDLVSYITAEKRHLDEKFARVTQARNIPRRLFFLRDLFLHPDHVSAGDVLISAIGSHAFRQGYDWLVTHVPLGMNAELGYFVERGFEKLFTDRGSPVKETYLIQKGGRTGEVCHDYFRD